MARTKLYQVKNNRILFTCGECKTRRSLAVAPNVRTRVIRCYKCSTLSRCALNRRVQRREQQSGKITMTLLNGKEISADVHDISPGGISIDVAPGGGRGIRKGEQVYLKCSWNKSIFAEGRYIVKNINGNRIGIENTAQKFML